MTIAERIKRIADKAKVPYSHIKMLIYSRYGNCKNNEIDNLNILEKQYEI